jgi:DNA-binding Lrp family transcriptional regulator
MTLKSVTRHKQKNSVNKDEITFSFSDTDKQLLNDFQHVFPLSTNPFKDIAEKIGISEQEVLHRYYLFQEQGIISRIGPVIRTNTIGASTLVAMEVPDDDIEDVAELVNGFTGVNHNYEREGKYNLWFVLTASDEEQLSEVLSDIEKKTGIKPLDLPMLDDYHIDLGFELQWQE